MRFFSFLFRLKEQRFSKRRGRWRRYLLRILRTDDPSVSLYCVGGGGGSGVLGRVQGSCQEGMGTTLHPCYTSTQPASLSCVGMSYPARNSRGIRAGWRPATARRLFKAVTLWEQRISNFLVLRSTASSSSVPVVMQCPHM